MYKLDSETLGQNSLGRYIWKLELLIGSWLLFLFNFFFLKKKQTTKFKRNLAVTHKTSEEVTAAVNSDEQNKARTDPYH